MKNEYYKNKPCLVTGIQGFIGSNIAKKLLEQDAKVIGLIKTKRPNSVLRAFKLEKKITKELGDLKDFDLINRIIGENQIQYIFHLGAHSSVKVCAQMPLEAIKTNVIGTANVLEAARGQNTIEAIVVASSDKAYGRCKNLPYKEDMPLNANEAYDSTKAMADILSQMYAHNYNMPIVITRCANAYGPGDLNPTRLFPSSIKKLLNNENPILYLGVEDYERELIYVEDIADAYLELGKNIQQVRGEAYNIGTGRTFRIGGLIERIRDEINKDIPIKRAKKAGVFKEIEKQWLDSTKIKKRINWKAKTSFEKGILKTIDWYKNNQEFL